MSRRPTAPKRSATPASCSPSDGLRSERFPALDPTRLSNDAQARGPDLSGPRPDPRRHTWLTLTLRAAQITVEAPGISARIHLEDLAADLNLAAADAMTMALDGESKLWAARSTHAA